MISTRNRTSQKLDLHCLWPLFAQSHRPVRLHVWGVWKMSFNNGFESMTCRQCRPIYLKVSWYVDEPNTFQYHTTFSGQLWSSQHGTEMESCQKAPIHPYMCMEFQTLIVRQTYRQADRHKVSKTYRHTYSQTVWQTFSQFDRQSVS